MGLDMYLSAKINFYPDWKESRRVDKPVMKTIRKAIQAHLGFEIPKTDNLDYIKVEFEAGYWRKANQIHKWFVDNVQDGEDNCGEYYVSREKLEELREICVKLLANLKLADGQIQNGYQYTKAGKKPIMEEGKYVTNPEVAEELLPTTEGFFFGSTNYDQWYYDDIKYTVEILDKCLTYPEEFEFYYQSSW